jgi:hypothetical protein
MTSRKLSRTNGTRRGSSDLENRDVELCQLAEECRFRSSYRRQPAGRVEGTVRTDLTNELTLPLALAQGSLDLTSDVALQAAHALSLGLALGRPFGEVLDRRLVAPSESHHHDAMKRSVGVTVTPAVQPVPGDLA